MNLKPLLGLELKDAAIIELLQVYDVDVIYSFDRLFENQADEYWASAKSEGLEFRFDENQRLATLFVYVRGNDEYSPRDISDSDIEIFNTPAEVIEFVNKHDLSHATNLSKPNIPHWVRIDYPDISVHYGFGKTDLGRITLMLPSSVPGAK